MRNMSYNNDYHINKLSIDLDKILNKIYYKFINPNGEIIAGLYYLEGINCSQPPRYI